MVNTRDYRLSHMERGEDYDHSILHGAWSRYMADHEKDIVVRWIRRRFSGRIPRYLDFACGTGRITQVVEKAADKSYGLDVSASMIEVARRKCACTEFLTMDMTRRDPEIEPVDLVTAFRFFGNAQEELRMAALAAIHRVLAQKGYLILNNHKNASSLRTLLRKWRGDHPLEDLSYRRLRSALTRSGFTIVQTQGIGFWLMRSKWKQETLLKSRMAVALEWSSRLPLATQMCPDVVILAQKT